MESFPERCCEGNGSMLSYEKHKDRLTVHLEGELDHARVGPIRAELDALLGDARLSDVLYPLEPKGFDVLPAASGVPELNDMRPDLRDMLLERLEPVLGKYDYIFMDLGAGISETVQTFAAMAAVRIVIITPEPTSLTDSYALIKVLNSRFGMRDFMVLVNQAESAKEAQAAFEKLNGACRHFLHLEPVLLGHVRMDKKLPEAVCRQQALLRYAPGSPAAQDIQALAGRLQRVRLSMADWLAPRGVLQAPPAAF